MDDSTKVTVSMYIGEQKAGEFDTSTPFREFTADDIIKKTAQKYGDCPGLAESVEYSIRMSLIKTPKGIRRYPVCKNRKRFIKKMMSIGRDRNTANMLAKAARLLYPVRPYQIFWIAVNDSRYRNRKLDRETARSSKQGL